MPMQQPAEQTTDHVRERDVWVRNSDRTVVYVHTFSDYDERLVGWQTLRAPLKTGICTEAQFLRRYRLMMREG